MADNNANNNASNNKSGGGNKPGNFFNEMWKELTKPPKWMKDGQKTAPPKKDGGKKTEADASHRPKKRQPPSWWSWSASDGVPKKKSTSKHQHHKKTGTKRTSSASVPRSLASDGVKKPPRSKSALSPLSKSQGPLGGDRPEALSQFSSQIRRHGFAPAVLKQYGLVPTKVEPFGPVLRLRTNHGLVALKKTDMTPQQIRFLHQAFQYLEGKKFTKFSPFVLTAKGTPYGQVGGDTYYITRWIRGQEVDLRSTRQLALAARTLAEFHDASRGFGPTGYRPSSMFDMVDRFADRRDELLLWKKRAQNKRRPDGVDQFFLKHVDLYIGQCDDAMKILRRAEIRTHLMYEEDDPCLCHLDLTPYNMVFTPNGQVVLIDLDFCTFGPRTLDLAHLIRRSLQRQEWDDDVAWHALVAYNAVRPLNRAEYRILHGLMIFPHRFWRVAYQHYEMGHDPNHLGYFQLCEAEEKNRQEFIAKLKRHVDRMG